MSGPAKLKVGRTTIDLLNQNDFSEWSDEELLRGQKKNALGRWSGKQPKVVPLGLLHELTRRRSTYATKKFADSLKDVADYLTGVAKGEIRPNKDRTHACEIILNRVWGMAPQRISLETIEPSEYEKAGVTKAIVIRDVGEIEAGQDIIDVDSEEEDPFG